MKLEEIKSRLGIEQVVKHYGISLNRQNKAVCPFCGDHGKPRPRRTFQIFPDTNRFTCFHSKCEKQFGRPDGDIFDLIERIEKCDTNKAIQKAREILGVPHTSVEAEGVSACTSSEPLKQPQADFAFAADD